MDEAVEDPIERLYREDGARLWRAMLAHTGDPHLADEVVAETYAQAIRRRDAIRDPPAWVWRTAFRIAMGMLAAREGARAQPPSEAISYEMPERAWDVLDAMASLTRKQRAAIVLHYYGGYRAREIASMIGSSAGAVRVHLSVGRKRLREALAERDG